MKSKKNAKDKDFLYKPIYLGGNAAIKQLIAKNIKYPDLALEKKIEGTVVIKYTVNHKGKVVKTKVVSGIGYGCNEEAERLVKLLSFNVAKTRKMKVIFNKEIKIHFRLPKEKTKKEPSIQYTTESKKSSKSSKSYNYTITF